MDSVFKNPDRVREQMRLPAVVEYSVVGLSTPDYHARLEELVVRLSSEENIHRRSCQASKGGAFTAYRFAIFQSEFGDVELFYREVGKLEGTKAVL